MNRGRRPGLFCPHAGTVAFIMVALGLTVARAEPLNVVTTTTDLASIARAVAGSHATVRSICAGVEDPHFLQAKPSYIMMARDADLWIRVGMELEIGWEGPILDAARNRSIREGTPGHLDASENVLRLEVPSTRITRALGDVHPMGNPHYWLDPLNARIVARSIADRLADIAPADAELFGRNLNAFQKALDEKMFGKELVKQFGGEKLWALELKGTLVDFLKKHDLLREVGGWLGKMLPLRGKKIVTYHCSWSYFANRFGLVVAAELEPKPGIPPSPSHLAAVIDRMKADNVRVVLMEPFYSRKAADLVASRTGAAVLVRANSVGGQPDATDYIAMIDMVVKLLHEALRAG